MKSSCPICGAPMALFFRQDGVPVHSVRLYRDRNAALACPTGDIQLGYCAGCGGIANLAFRPEDMDYGPGYRPTQACSPTFRAFDRALAERLVEGHGLYRRRILEVGCGDGGFLEALCRAGESRGRGYDPCCQARSTEAVELVPERFTPEQAEEGEQADLVICKMTLEHIAEPVPFMAMLAAAAAPAGVVVVQVPEAGRILKELAFWDVYYEHVCYWTAGSLAGLLARAGLEVLTLETLYDGQYLLATARVAPGRQGPDDRAEVAQAVERFSQEAPLRIAAWRQRLDAGGPTLVWGAGSKGVAFVEAVGAERVAGAVDIDPVKQGGWLPHSGLPILAPAALQGESPDRIILMNPVYRPEVTATLEGLGVGGGVTLP